ncbi:unnamed protein product [Rangifer tarandus platyrhynchus]|uniref:Uncharacterized protein n=1 Tax=Rangifer tarandus platyrhynchus TaxID=3082113 RepID=A0ABN8YVK9_RANTA|nr:unnamed protein product [Rangifer tarandus platyrhynchus]
MKEGMCSGLVAEQPVLFSTVSHPSRVSGQPYCYLPGSGRSSGEGNATCSSIVAWEIPWPEEPGGLQSVGPHSWAEQLSTHAPLPPEPEHLVSGFWGEEAKERERRAEEPTQPLPELVVPYSRAELARSTHPR